MLDHNTDTYDSNSGIDVDDENGPIRNEKWWKNIKSEKLITGLMCDKKIKPDQEIDIK